jgi:hypothetical protein
LSGKPLFSKFNKNTDVIYRYAGVSNNYNSLQMEVDRRFSGGFLLTTTRWETPGKMADCGTTSSRSEAMPAWISTTAKTSFRAMCMS